MKKSASCPSGFRRPIPPPQPPRLTQLIENLGDATPPEQITPILHTRSRPRHGRIHSQARLHTRSRPRHGRIHSQARLPTGRALVQTNTTTESISTVFNFILANARQFTLTISDETGYDTFNLMNSTIVDSIENIQWVRFVRVPYNYTHSEGFAEGDTYDLAPFINNIEDFTLPEGGSINIEFDNDSFLAMQYYNRPIEDVGRDNDDDLDLDFSTTEVLSTIASTTREVLSTVEFTWSDEMEDYIRYGFDVRTLYR